VRRVAGAAGVAIVGAVVALVATWSVSTPWDAPVWPLFAFVPVPALVWWLVADAPGRVRATAGVLVVAVVVGTVAVWASPLPGRLRFGSTLDALEQSAVVVLADAPTPSEACGPPPPLDYGVLGEPSGVCVVAYALGVATASTGDDRGDGTVTETEVRQVRFDWQSTPRGPLERSLVFEGGIAQPPAGRCVRQVDGRWWAWSLPDGGCPRGFTPSSG